MYMKNLSSSNADAFKLVILQITILPDAEHYIEQDLSREMGLYALIKINYSLHLAQNMFEYLRWTLSVPRSEQFSKSITVAQGKL